MLPSDFRGSIAYSGTHQGTLVQGRRTQQLGGSVTITLDYDGARVTARYSGTGGMNSGTLSGTRSATNCRLVDDRGGDVLEAECTRTRFVAVSSQSSRRQQSSARIDARAVRVAGGPQVSPPHSTATPPARSPVAPTAPAAEEDWGPLTQRYDFDIYCFIYSSVPNSGINGEDAFGSLYVGGLRDRALYDRLADDLERRADAYAAASEANRNVMRRLQDRCRREYPL